MWWWIVFGVLVLVAFGVWQRLALRPTYRLTATVLLALANLPIAPDAPWSSDRSQDQGFRLRRMGGINPVKHPPTSGPA